MSVRWRLVPSPRRFSRDRSGAVRNGELKLGMIKAPFKQDIIINFFIFRSGWVDHLPSKVTIEINNYFIFIFLQGLLSITYCHAK